MRLTVTAPFWSRAVAVTVILRNLGGPLQCEFVLNLRCFERWMQYGLFWDTYLANKQDPFKVFTNLKCFLYSRDFFKQQVEKIFFLSFILNWENIVTFRPPTRSQKKYR